MPFRYGGWGATVSMIQIRAQPSGRVLIARSDEYHVERRGG